MNFNCADQAFNVEPAISINPENQIFSDGIGLLEPNDSQNYGSDVSSTYQIPNNLYQQIDIRLIQDFDYLGNIAFSQSLLGVNQPQSASNKSTDILEPQATNSSTATNNSTQSTDLFGVPTNNNPPQSSQSSNNAPQTSNTPSNDWFSQNLLDAQLITKTRNLAADGQLSRNDMIAIFRDAQDDSVIDTNEYKDLQKIVSNSSYFRMDDYVTVLSSKVVFGTSANANYQGQTLGNLYAGSSSSQMEKLIGKWFLGTDRPSTPYTYKKAEGSLFQNGASYSDISQGVIGDCYLLAGLAEVAIHSPSTIVSMFIDNGDETYTVRFYNKGVADYVTVDKYLPVDSVNEFIYANQAGAKWGKYNDPNNELWVALAEKAYAQINESGWIGQDGTNSYAGIIGGWDTDAISQISGVTARSSQDFNLNALVNAYQAGTLMGITSKTDSSIDSRIISNHIYVFLGYDASTQQFTLFNPWGVDGGLLNGRNIPGILTLSINELRANFYQWSYIQ